MGLVSTMEELITHANATSGKFPSPSLEPHRKLLYSREARIPINLFTQRNLDVVMGFPVVVDIRAKQSLIAMHLVEGRLFDPVKTDGPRFMKQIGEVEGLGVQAPAED